MDVSLRRLYSLLLLSVFAGYVCKGQDGYEDDAGAVTGQANTSEANATGTAKTIMAADPTTPQSTLDPGRMAASHKKLSITLHPVLPSVIVNEGQQATLQCTFSAPPEAKVIWKRFCAPNCSNSFNITETTNLRISSDVPRGRSELIFHRAQRSDTGMYYCYVFVSASLGSQSCGTYFWVRKVRPVAFLNMNESVKNKIITIEGVLLLICAIGPGLFLLFRKRSENERLLKSKKATYEEENLYEGLNLDDCSMYEDISRGLQATYQDIGNIKVIDLQVEKPEKP